MGFEPTPLAQKADSLPTELSRLSRHCNMVEGVQVYSIEIQPPDVTYVYECISTTAKLVLPLAKS